MTHAKRNTATGSVALLFAVLMWGGMFPVAKSALQVLDAYWLTLIRYGSGALLFVLLLWVVEGRKHVNLERRGWALWLYGTAGFAGFSIRVCCFVINGTYRASQKRPDKARCAGNGHSLVKHRNAGRAFLGGSLRACP